jgi:hypothetical protein
MTQISQKECAEDRCSRVASTPQTSLFFMSLICVICEICGWICIQAFAGCGGFQFLMASGETFASGV